MATPSSVDPLVTHRRMRLLQWINDQFGGMQVKFIADCAKRDHHINQGELSGLLKNKSFGEKKARRLEQMAGMPERWLDELQPARNASSVVQAAGIYWPFQLVTFERLDALMQALSARDRAAMLEAMDQQLHAIAYLWENKPRAAPAKRAAR